MISSSIQKIVVVVFSIFVVGFVFFFWKEQIRQESLMQTMNESIQVAAIYAIDYATRVSESTTLSEDKFEQKFKETFLAEVNYEVENPQFKFEYLYDEYGNVKSVKVKMTCDGLSEQVYEVSYIADVKGNS